MLCSPKVLLGERRIVDIAPGNECVLAAAGVVLPVDVVVGEDAVYCGLRALTAVFAERPQEQRVCPGLNRVRHLR